MRSIKFRTSSTFTDGKSLNISTSKRCCRISLFNWKYKEIYDIKLDEHFKFYKPF